jgi:hypothetical protein
MTTSEIRITTVAAFKRFLMEPGATVQVIRNDWTDPTKTTHPLTPKVGYWEPKQVQRVQSNTVQFTSGSWLAFPKASHVRFDGDTVTLCMHQDGTFKDVLVYKLTRTETGAAQ